MKTEIKDNQLYFAKKNVVELAEKFGTPLYVVSEDAIVEKIDEIKRVFLNKYPNTRAVFASKSFLNMAMCKVIKREGLGLDVVSGGELITALRTDFPSDLIIFHGNNKSLEELELAVENNVGRIVVDNFQELDLLQQIANEKDTMVKILFRVSPGIDNIDTHKYNITGQKDTKFGIPLEPQIINQAIKRAIEYKNIELMGFHFHVGSQLKINKYHLAAIDTVTEIMGKIYDEYNFEIKELNTGGGFGIRYSQEEEEAKSLEYFTDAIMERLELQCKNKNIKMPLVIIEPGRWLIAEAGITVYKIGAIKEIPNMRTYASVDGGMTDNIRPALYGAKYEAIVANRSEEEKNKTVTIAGKHCESGDILIWDLKVPEIKTDDILVVLATGAYGYSMANNYNRSLIPEVVMINGDNVETIVRRQNYDDLLSRDIIPQRLINE